MKQYYFLEGYRAKSSSEVEDTLILDDKHAYTTEEKALEKAKDYLEDNPELNLVIINKGYKLGDKYAVKYLFRNQDGQVDEVTSWWGDTVY